MLILAYSSYNAGTIDTNYGRPEYSYWFVRKAFSRILERFGVVIPIGDAERDVEAVAQNAAAQGDRGIYLSFDSVYKTVFPKTCPTVPVFAWEFDTIPHEVWDDEPRHDWTMVLAKAGCAITHSSFTVGVVRRALGDDFPIWSIPAPVYAGAVRHLSSARGYQPPTELKFSATVIDVNTIDLGPYIYQRKDRDGPAALQSEIAKLKMPTRISIHGVVYSSVFNPLDGRKNWNDMLMGFIRAFRNTPDATLILKLTHVDGADALMRLLSDVAKVGPFRCRILLIHGMLPQDEYDALMAATSYGVNTSNGEGQCLPLMEYMSAGRPAISPRHTAMLDYITDENAFVLRTTEEPTWWPHDPRRALRCRRNRLDFPTLLEAYRKSYEVASNGATYARMSAAATEAQRLYCGDDVVMARFAEVLNHTAGMAKQPKPASGKRSVRSRTHEAADVV
ncbi:glycosyltransferase [Methylovirgula sp. 4M-Z18]|uniref:glycosyltransferase n=1 Tax=Methylovirgula sp. 4M-Z18 TaxID=2293567 RepID=UPI000E2F0FCA|nr:glycosyltransferase [Methylovirgula sp. 4M-Z18]RFB80645.1 glycosyltransferase family 1 protein [Methylovirgula sp. 4M-Z18]